MKEKIGIIDIGGGLRGIYGAGIFDYLIANNIEIPYTIGVSAGSANIASYIAKQKGRNRRFYEVYSMEKEYMSLSHYRKTGSYINFEYIYGTLSNEDGLDPWDFDVAKKSNQDMVVVSTDANTGKSVYFYKKDFVKNDYGFFAASCCLPVFDKPYEWHGKKYFDGAVANQIPYKKAFEDGCTRVIVILTRPITFRKSIDKTSKFYKTLSKSYPIIEKKLYEIPSLYNSQLEDLIKNYVPDGKALIVAPDTTKGLKTLTKDRAKLDKLYHKGFSDGEQIKNFLEKYNIKN